MSPTTADGVLVRFGEIGIKSAPVRRAMVERLRNNLLSAMQRAGVEGDVTTLGARLWMAGPDVERLLLVATHTFGVVSASPVRRAAGTLEAIAQVAVEEALAAWPWATFAVRASREGNHPFTSQDLQVQVGSAIWKAVEARGGKPKVDLGKPAFEVHLDVRGERAYVFTRNVSGPGGIPVGSQGHAVALLSDEASFLAAWLMMRRGCGVTGLHAGTTGSLPVQAAATLVQWGMEPDVELLPVCTGTVAKPVLLEAAARVARDHRAAVLVTGETLHSAFAAAPVPVLRPVCGLDPAEVERVRQRAGLGPVTADGILDAGSSETPQSLLAMRRTVTP